MKKIILSENQISNILLNEIFGYNKDASDRDREKITDFMRNNGQLMYSVKSNKPYIIYEIPSLMELLGSRYALAQLVKDNDAYGQIMIKPFTFFKMNAY